MHDISENYNSLTAHKLYDHQTESTFVAQIVIVPVHLYTGIHYWSSQYFPKLKVHSLLR